MACCEMHEMKKMAVRITTAASIDQVKGQSKAEVLDFICKNLNTTADGYLMVKELVEGGASGGTLTAFAVGDVATYIKFDTSKEAELLAFLQGLDYGSEGQVNLISYDNGTNESGSPLTGVVLMACNFGETYMLMSANGDMPTPIYSTGDFAMDTIVVVPGWQNLDENNVWTLAGSYTVSDLVSAESWNGILAGK